MAKFKVDDQVRMKVNHSVKFHILEVTTQVCYSNCAQNWYTGRMYSKSNVDKDMSKFSEIELETIPEKSTDLILLEEQLQTVADKKLLYIKKSDFDKAAIERDKETTLKSAVLTQKRKDGIDYGYIF